jgi:hypothetical protein
VAEPHPASSAAAHASAAPPAVRVAEGVIS